MSTGTGGTQAAFDDAPLGYHLSLSIGAAARDALDDIDAMRALVKTAAAAGRSRIVEMRAHRFDPHGITVVAILSESHIALHTWPEHHCLTLDMFTCSIEPTETRGLVDRIIEVVGGRLYALSQQPRQAPPSLPSGGVHDNEAGDANCVTSAPEWCPACGGARVDSAALAGWLVAAVDQRPSRERSLGQNPVTHATNARRATYIRARDDDRGDLLVIGDDDATSVAIAAVSRCRSLTVVDYDPRVVEYLAAVSSRFDLGISTRYCDVASGVPADLVGSADCVVCDPIPSADGMRLFFDFARETLRPHGVLYTSAVPTDAPNLGEFHREVSDAGFLITDMVPAFSDYPGDLAAIDPVRPAGSFEIVVDEVIEFSETWIRLVRGDDETRL